MMESCALESVAAKRKEARINIRMSSHDVDQFKAIAETEGLGYQTLISSVLHKLINGLLVDRKILDEVKSVFKK